MKKISVLIIVFTFASVITGCTNTQNATTSSTQNSYATVSTSTSVSSSLTTTASTTVTSSTTSTYLSPSTTSTNGGSTSTVGNTTVQPVTLSGLAQKLDASIGQFEKTYYYSEQTGRDQISEYSLKIISIKTVNNKDIKMVTVFGKQSFASVLDYEFLDKNGKQFEERPIFKAILDSTESSIEFSTESDSNLANHTKFIVMKGLDATKNNGITNVIFEVVK